MYIDYSNSLFAIRMHMCIIFYSCLWNCVRKKTCNALQQHLELGKYGRTTHEGSNATHCTHRNLSSRCGSWSCCSQKYQHPHNHNAKSNMPNWQTYFRYGLLYSLLFCLAYGSNIGLHTTHGSMSSARCVQMVLESRWSSYAEHCALMDNLWPNALPGRTSSTNLSPQPNRRTCKFLKHTSRTTFLGLVHLFSPDGA